MNPNFFSFFIVPINPKNWLIVVRLWFRSKHWNFTPTNRKFRNQWCFPCPFFIVLDFFFFYSVGVVFLIWFGQVSSPSFLCCRLWPILSLPIWYYRLNVARWQQVQLCNITFHIYFITENLTFAFSFYFQGFQAILFVI